MTSHYDWKNGEQACPSCGWVGLGSDTEIGEIFNDGAEYHCPDCNYRFGYIAYPLLSESLTDSRAPQSDRIFAEIATRHTPGVNASFTIKNLAHAYLRTLLLWLIACFIGSLLTGWISAWAGDRGGWEGQLVQIVFGFAGAVAFLAFLMFCVLLYSWFSSYKLALRDSAELNSNRELFMHRYRDVFGPIPWR